MTPGAGGLQQARRRSMSRQVVCGNFQLTVRMIASQLDSKKPSLEDYHQRFGRAVSLHKNGAKTAK